MIRPAFVAAVILALIPAGLSAAPEAATAGGTQPRIEHIAVWVENVDKTSGFLSDALGWNRHSLVFGVDDDDKTFGGMKLAFVDANGLWLELVEPTTPGPGMDFLKQKGNGSLVELDFHINDFDKNLAEMKARGINLVGMDGKPLKNGGLLSEWAIKDGKRVRGEERLSYLPPDVSRGTSIELFWEYPSGVVNYRDQIWTDAQRTPPTAPRIDHTVVLAADLDKSNALYGDVLRLPREPRSPGTRKDWMGVGDARHTWFRANDTGFGIQVVAPPSTPAGKALLENSKYGDGAIMELGVEVSDIEAFYDKMKGKGYVLTAGDGAALPKGQKSVSMQPAGDCYGYFPLGKSEGMRIMVFQRAGRK